jgi:hypothetical protein
VRRLYRTTPGRPLKDHLRTDCQACKLAPRPFTLLSNVPLSGLAAHTPASHALRLSRALVSHASSCRRLRPAHLLARNGVLGLQVLSATAMIIAPWT